MEENKKTYEEFRRYNSEAPEDINRVIYRTVESRRRLFRYACDDGYLEVAKTFYSFPRVKTYLDHFDFSHVITWAFTQKNYEVAQWAYQAGRRKLKSWWFSPLTVACMCNDLETAEKLLQKNPEDEVEVFMDICQHGTLGMLQFAYKAGGYKKCTPENISDYVRFACYDDGLDKVKFLFSTENASHIDIDKCFMYAISVCAIEIADWLYNLGRIDIQSKYEEICSFSFDYTESGKKKVYEWLNKIIHKE